MRVLDRADAQAFGDVARDELRDERGLSRSGEAGDAATLIELAPASTGV